MENELEVLNPDIQEIMIGKRKLRKITLYPLSVVDQFKVTDLFVEVIGALLSQVQSKENMRDASLILLFTTTIKVNLPKILGLVLDPAENVDSVMEEITNNQLNEIGNALYAMNYEKISKNVGGLLKDLQKKQQKESLLVRPLPQSAESTDTNLKTFSGNLGETED